MIIINRVTSVFDLDKIIGSKVLITTRRYWKYLDKTPEFAIMVSDPVTNHSSEYLNRFMDSYPKEVYNAKTHGIIAFGSGRVMDFGKFVAKELDAKDLILIPGTITTHSPWTKLYGVRNFEKNTIQYIEYPGKIILEYKPELLHKIHKKEDLPWATQWSIPGLFSHATASWEAKYLHDIGGMDDQINTMVSMIMALPELGTLDWFYELEHIFQYSMTLKNIYGTVCQKGTEHYIAYWEELIGGRETHHGKLVSLGIDQTLKLQNKPQNQFKDEWEKLKDIYKLGVFPSWEDDELFPYESITKFIKYNNFGKTI